MLLLLSADFFKINFLKKIISGTLSECQTVWINTRTGILFVLVWIQTMQMKEVVTSMEFESVKLSNPICDHMTLAVGRTLMII